MMRTIRDALNQRVLLGDGAITRSLRVPGLDLNRDFFGAEDMVEVLNLTRRSMVRDIHIAFLQSGADIIRTNSLNASPLTLAANGLGDEAFIINYTAAEIAVEAVDSVPGKGRRRFVLGVVRDAGWDVAPGEIEKAVDIQAQGLIAGGVDGIILDVLPGVGRIQAMLSGARKARAALDASASILLQHPHNSANFSDRIRALSDGTVCYRPGNIEKKKWLDEVIAEGRANLVGGGVSPDETQVLDERLRELAEDGFRPMTSWVRREENVDEFQPASSWMEFPEEIVPA